MRACTIAIPTPSKKAYIPAMFLGTVAAVLDIGLKYMFSGLGFTPGTAYIISFVFSLHCAYLLLPFVNKQEGSPSQDAGRRLREYAEALLLMLAVLFLRGALLYQNPASPAADSPFIMAGQVLTVLTAWFLILVVPRNGRLFQLIGKGDSMLLAAVVGYLLLLRLCYLGTADLIQEEAYYWNYAQHLDFGYLDHPPVVALLIWLGTACFGVTEFGVRIGAFFCWFVTAWFVWRYSRLVFDRKTAGLSILLTSMLPIFFFTGLTMTPDAPLIAAWSGTLYFLYRALVLQHRRAWVGAGIMMGIGLASKYTIALLGPAALVFMLVDPRARKELASLRPYGAAVMALLLFSPVIFWNYEHDWASFLFQSQRRLSAVSKFHFHELLLYILILITPVGLWTVFTALLPKQWHLRPCHAKEIDRASYRFILIMTIVPLSVFVLFSLSKEVKLSWTGPIWLASLPLLAASLANLGNALKKPRPILQRTWNLTFIMLFIIYGSFLHYFTMGLPGIPFPRDASLLGWSNLALQLEKKINTVEEETGHRPILVGMDKYRVTSGLGFYRTKIFGEASNSERQRILTETAGRHIFGDIDLMYRYWQYPEIYRDRDMIAVTSDPSELDRHRFVPYIANIGEIRKLSFTKQGKTVGPIYYRLLSGYSPTGNEISKR